MEIRVERLRQALTLVEPAVAKKATLPIIQNVLVAAGQLHATNLEVAVLAPLPEAGDARFILPFKQVKEALSHLPGYELLQVDPPTADESKLSFRTSRTQFQFYTSPPDDFPPMAKQPEHEAEVDGDVFLAGLEEVVSYSATEQSRPILVGVCVTLGDPVEVAAADGFRLAWKPLGFSIAVQDGPQSMVIPSASISLLRKVWRNAPKAPAFPSGAERELVHSPSIGVARMVVAKRPMKLWFNAHQLSCRFGGVNVMTQLLEGQFPDYKPLIPFGQDKRVVMDAENILQALRQVRGMAADGSGIIRLLWEGTQLRVEARGEETGDASVTIPCVSQGEPAHIAFNSRYLLEYFTGRQGQVMLEVTSASSPGLFTYRGMPHVVLMPMFVQWAGDPPAEGMPTEETPAETAPGEEQQKPSRRRGRKATAAVAEKPAEPDEAPPHDQLAPGNVEAPAEKAASASSPTRSKKPRTRK